MVWTTLKNKQTYPFSSPLSFSTSIVSSSSLSEELKSWFLFILSVHNSPTVCLLVLSSSSASVHVCPESLCLKHSAFPRCHFNAGADLWRRGLGSNQPITKRPWVWVTAQLAQTHASRLWEVREEEKKETSHSMDIWKFLKRVPYGPRNCSCHP